MSAFLQAIIIGLTLTACHSTIDKRDTKKSEQAGAAAEKEKAAESNPDVAKQPTNVSGDLNLHSLTCDVTNTNDQTAQISIIGCIVKNQDGSKYTGDVSSVVADIYVNGLDKPVSGEVTVLGKDQSYSITILANAKPSLATSVKVNALIGGKSEQWLVQLIVDTAHVNKVATDLYVRANDPKAGAFCLKDAPCSSITKALTFVYENIQDVVTIHVATGIYSESIVFSGKSFGTEKGRIVIIGEDSDFSKSASFQLAPPVTVNAGVAVSSQVDYLSDLKGIARFQFKNMNVTRGSTQTVYGSNIAYGIYARDADVLFENVQIIGAWDIAVGASFNAQMYLRDITATGFVDAGIDVFSNAQMYLQKDIMLSGGTTGIRAEQQGQLFWDINSDDDQANVSIDFGQQLDPNLKYVGLHVLDAQAAELDQAGSSYSPAVVVIKDATEAIRVEHGKMILNASNITASGCQSRCIVAADYGLIRFQGLTNGSQMSLSLAGVSEDSGSIFAADGFSTIDLKDYTGLKMCNIQSNAISSGKNIVSADSSSLIRVAIAASMPKTTYAGCQDASANRLISVTSNSQVTINGVAQTNGSVFTP